MEGQVPNVPADRGPNHIANTTVRRVRSRKCCKMQGFRTIPHGESRPEGGNFLQRVRAARWCFVKWETRLWRRSCVLRSMSFFLLLEPRHSHPNSLQTCSEAEASQPSQPWAKDWKAVQQKRQRRKKKDGKGPRPGDYCFPVPTSPLSL